MEQPGLLPPVDRNYANIYWETMGFKEGEGKARRISESTLTVINPLNKVIEDSRGSVGVNLRRL